MATTNKALRERVRCGAELLDREQPSWCERIDVPRLRTSSPRRCVLGQVYGTYGRGLDVLGIRFRVEPYGFCGLGNSEYLRLDMFWREAIEARCLQETPSDDIQDH